MAESLTLDSRTIADGGVAVIVAGDLRIAVFRSGDTFHAIDELCPHQGGSFAKGDFDGRIVTCPLHRFQIDVTTGRSPQNRFLKVRRYAIERDGAMLRIAI